MTAREIRIGNNQESATGFEKVSSVAAAGEGGQGLRACLNCKNEFQAKNAQVFGKTIWQKLCNRCQTDRDDDQRARVRRNAEADRAEAVRRVIPPMYLAIPEASIPIALQKEINDKWNPPKGIGIIGPAGTFKTTALAHFLANAMEKWGKRCEFINGAEFSRVAGSIAVGRDEKIRDLRTAEILLFDDIGKGKFTETSEQELWALLEYRTSHLKPTLWTANSGAKKLSGMLSDDRSASIIGRLGDYSEIIQL